MDICPGVGHPGGARRLADPFGQLRRACRHAGASALGDSFGGPGDGLSIAAGNAQPDQYAPAHGHAHSDVATSHADVHSFTNTDAHSRPVRNQPRRTRWRLLRRAGPDGQILALGSGAIKPLYRVGDCEVQSDACLVRVGLLHGANPLVDQISWSPDGETLVFMGGSSVWFFDVSGCASGQGACGAWQRTVEQPSPEIAEAFGPDWTVAVSGGYGGRVYLWALDDGRLLHTLRDAHDTVDGLAFSPAHAILASVGQDDNVCVWHLLPEPRNPDREDLLYQDDFSDPDSGWTVVTKDDYEIGYQEGVYRLALDRDSTIIWGAPEPALSLDDFAVEVDIHLLVGPSDGNLGLMIRLDSADNVFYLFRINGGGEYSVVLRAEDEWTSLVGWTPTDAANVGPGADNRLRVVCDGERFSFYVNDVHVMDVTDDTLDSGSIGLTVGAFDESGIEVHFDNLKVYGLAE